ncbi:hypothetical protein OJAV_G00124820 [Oryzias javanicus]|uniref:UDP-glucuronosyltransferase n=1 Tax=Oryzias javanicus TaxID=123683 RepID=A0A437CVS4_ORYJA|nr:hypothetical protein OJAV_G00124820 [Oryzias javanicus]
MKLSTAPLFSSGLLLIIFWTPTDGGKVLAFPGEFSHWLNMRTIIEELVKRNHSVTVLVPEASPSVNYNNSRDAAKFNFLVFKVPFTRSDYVSMMQEFMDFSMYEMHRSSLLQLFLRMGDFMRRSSDLGVRQCDAMLRNRQLMATLRAAAYDVVLVDPLVMCGDLVADVLGVPLILSLRFSFGSTLERHCGHAPFPPSFVPTAPLPFSDRMSFVQRLSNALMTASMSMLHEALWKLKLDPYYSEVKGSPSSYCGTFGKADIWLIRTFWDLETPRPFPPNFKFVGGLHCKPANQLPEDLEAFVQSSGEAGVVVVTFGSMVTNLTAERAQVIASGLGRIPQKVIWRYRGDRPAALAPNTKLYDWIPQNDLLGHPRTRAFVTHGGTNGLYEALFHGVPVVGVPLFGDQPDNLARISRHGAALVLNFNSMTADDLTGALHAVINQPSFRSSMRRLSDIQRHQPVAPLDAAVFWVEFVMRHGGATHLRLASHDLTWIQYYSLDTGAALLLALLTAGAVFWAGLVHVLLRCRRRARRQKTD